MLDLQKKIKSYLKKRNWHNNPPADIAKSISIEAAELLEHFQWHNYSVEELRSDTQKFDDMKEEVADVFIYLAGMAIACGFDLEKVVINKIEKVEKKYPAHVIKYGDREVYMKIKKQERLKRKKGVN